MVMTEKPSKYRLKKEASAQREEIMLSLSQVLNLPTTQELEDYYAGYPSRLHIAPDERCWDDRWWGKIEQVAGGRQE